MRLLGAVVGCAVAAGGVPTSWAAGSGGGGGGARPHVSVGVLAREDYTRNVFDPHNVTAATEIIFGARMPVNTNTTAATWHTDRPRFRPQPPALPCNIAFVKLLKVAGSTAGGVCRRIAAHRGEYGVFDKSFPQPNRTEPGVWADHGRFSVVESMMARLSQPTLVLGWVREPLMRCMSAYYFFQVGRARHEDTDENKLEYMSAACVEMQFPALATAKPEEQPVGFLSKPLLDQVTGLFHFIGVTERFDESLVVMKNLFGLSYSDILYLPSKVAGTEGLATHRAWADESPEVQDYGRGSEFYMQNRLDFMLHAHVNAVLDEYVARIPDFQAQLDSFRSYNAAAAARCQAGSERQRERHAVRPGLDEVGCYHSDNGCGFACLDHFAEVTLGMNHSNASQPPPARAQPSHGHRVDGGVRGRLPSAAAGAAAAASRSGSDRTEYRVSGHGGDEVRSPRNPTARARDDADPAETGRARRPQRRPARPHNMTHSNALARLRDARTPTA